MKVSVVIPFYNELHLINRAVSSVHANFEPGIDFEVLICNDGPIENDKIYSALSEEFSFSLRVLCNSGERGPGAARNIGLDASDGDLVAFLDADDYWLPGKLAMQLEAVKLGGTFVATSYRFAQSSVVVAPPTSIRHPRDVFLKRGIGTSTVLITRSLCIGNRFRNFRFAQDIDFWYQLSQSPYFVYRSVPDQLVVYNATGSTSNKWEQLCSFSNVLQVNGVGRLVFISVLFSYIVTGLQKHFFSK